MQLRRGKNRNVQILHLIVKRLLLHYNCSPFALQLGFICIAKGVQLQGKDGLIDKYRGSTAVKTMKNSFQNL